jgi:hypothetical protein
MGTNIPRAWLFLSVLCMGCLKRIDFGPRGQILDAEDLLGKVRATEDRLRSVQADGRMKVETPQQSAPWVDVFLSAARPNRIYLEIHDFFGKPQASLVCDGERFGVYQAAEGRYYRGPATPANVSRLLPMELSAAEIVGFALGAPLKIQAKAMRLTVDERAGAYRVELQAEGMTQNLWIHPRTFRVLRSTLQDQRGIYEVRFDEFLEAGEVALPLNVTVEALSAKAKIALRYKHDEGTALVLNRPPDATVFEPIPPPQIPAVDVDAWGNVMGATPAR